MLYAHVDTELLLLHLLKLIIDLTDMCVEVIHDILHHGFLNALVLLLLYLPDLVQVPLLVDVHQLLADVHWNWGEVQKKIVRNVIYYFLKLVRVSKDVLLFFKVWVLGFLQGTQVYQNNFNLGREIITDLGHFLRDEFLVRPVKFGSDFLNMEVNYLVYLILIIIFVLDCLSWSYISWGKRQNLWNDLLLWNVKGGDKMLDICSYKWFGLLSHESISFDLN